MKPISERINQRTKTVLKIAETEAREAGQPAVDSEHLLLAVIREDNLAGTALRILRQDPKAVYSRARAAAPHGEATGDVERKLAPAALACLKLAAGEADRMGNDFLGAEHLLLGLIAEPDGLGGAILRGAGVTLDEARTAVAGVQEGRTDSNRNLNWTVPAVADAPDAPREAVPRKGCLGALLFLFGCLFGSLKP